jgi:mRNA-binding protein PUF3
LNNASSSAYYQPRNSSFAQNSISKPIKEPLDPTSASFTTTHHPDSFANDLSRFAFGQPDNTNGRSDPSATPWSDAASLHSPGDDRHSQAASEYFGSSSAAPSRSGSLPPSRHGETVQYPDKYARYAQANNRQTASFSVGHLGAYPERNGSFQSDSLAAYAQLLREQNLDGGSVSHRPSLSSTSLAHHVDRYATDPSTLRESTGAVHLPTKSDAYSQMATGTYTPEGQWQGGLTDANPQFRPLRFDGRSAHNASLSRQSPQYSNIHTPPNSDRYQFQAENAISNGANIAMVERKLVGLQQQQLQALNAQQYIPHQPHVQHLHMTTVPNMMPNARPYYYAVPNGVPVLPAYPVPYQGVPHSAPRGPKDQQQQCPMSQCLFEFKSFYQKTNKKYTLKDIYNHVVEFSGDQAGSRFIQNEIAQANSEEKQRVFSEIIVDARQLMTDVFGNYVIQKFFEFGDQTQKRLLANTMKGHISELSTNTYGCRVVQKVRLNCTYSCTQSNNQQALEHVLTEQQIELIRELQKEVLYCVKNANGNHVIQKAIERIPAKHIQFIMDSFKGNVASLSVEQYGCRVIQRVLEYCEPQTTRFVLDEIHADEERILSHQFGNYVTQHVLKHGSPEDRTKIIELIKTDIVKYSNHKFASNVVEACFLYGSDEQRREIVLKVKERNQRGESNISRLIKDQFGNYVIRTLSFLIPLDTG